VCSECRNPNQSNSKSSFARGGRVRRNFQSWRFCDLPTRRLRSSWRAPARMLRRLSSSGSSLPVSQLIQRSHHGCRVGMCSTRPSARAAIVRPSRHVGARRSSSNCTRRTRKCTQHRPFQTDSPSKPTERQARSYESLSISGRLRPAGRPDQHVSQTNSHEQNFCGLPWPTAQSKHDHIELNSSSRGPSVHRFRPLS